MGVARLGKLALALLGHGDTQAQRFCEYSERAKAQELCEMRLVSPRYPGVTTTATVGFPSEAQSAKGFCPVTRRRMGTG